MMPLMLYLPLPTLLVFAPHTVRARVRLVTAKPARVSLARRGMQKEAVARGRGGIGGGSKGRARGWRQSLITHYLDMHVG